MFEHILGCTPEWVGWMVSAVLMNTRNIHTNVSHEWSVIRVKGKVCVVELNALIWYEQLYSKVLFFVERNIKLHSCILSIKWRVHEHRTARVESTESTELSASHLSCRSAIFTHRNPHKFIKFNEPCLKPINICINVYAVRTSYIQLNERMSHCWH